MEELGVSGEPEYDDAQDDGARLPLPQLGSAGRRAPRAAAAVTLPAPLLAGTGLRVRVRPFVSPGCGPSLRPAAAAAGVSAAHPASLRPRRRRSAVGALPSHADAVVGGARSAVDHAPAGGPGASRLPAAVASVGGRLVGVEGAPRRLAPS